MNSSILIIEDSEEDYEAISDALLRAGVPGSQLTHLHDGTELSQFLRQSQESDHTERPSVILLDLNLPGANGHTILSEIRRDQQMGLVPVVIFSTSSAARDINLAYECGANSYMLKPMSLEEFDPLMAHFKVYWLETVVACVIEPRRLPQPVF